MGARPASTGSMVTVIGSLRYRSEIHGDFACVDMPGLYRPKGARLRRIHRELANPQAQVSSPFFPSFQLPEPFATDRIPLTMHHRALRVRITQIERNIDFLHHRLQLIPPSRPADLQYTKTQLSVLKRCLKLLRSEYARMGKGLPVETPIRKRRLCPDLQVRRT